MSADSERFTLDTNLLVYSVDATAGVRHQLAIEIVDRATERDCCLTLQALSEFYAAVTRKGMVPAAEAAAQAENWRPPRHRRPPFASPSQTPRRDGCPTGMRCWWHAPEKPGAA